MAQKMRAAMTYMFGRIHGLGTLPWQESEVTGKMKGNPSVCEIVSTYMVSLRRRKVQFTCLWITKSKADKLSGTGWGDCNQCTRNYMRKCV
jgi:hypothetical protein